MGDDETKWDLAISRLKDKTESGEIKWAPVPDLAAKCRAGERVLGVPFLTEVLGTRFLVYEYEYRTWPSEDEWHPAREVAVEVVNDQGEMQFRVPRTDRRWHLLHAIREHASGAKDFLEKFLEDS